MIRQKLILILLLNSLISYSQDTIHKYYDEHLIRVPKAQASFHKIIYKNKNKKWVAKKFTIDGMLVSHGTFANRRLTKKNGYFADYYINGKILAEGHFVKDLKEGLWIIYHKNGMVKDSVRFVNNKKNGKWIRFYDNGQIDSYGYYKNGNKDGEWIYYFTTGEVSAKDQYVHGYRLKCEFFNKKGQSVPLKKAQYPSYGINSVISYLQRRTIYPKSAIRNNIEGTVYIKFVTDEDGYIIERQVFTSVCPVLDEEAMRVAGLVEKINPAKSHNRITTIYYLPVKFTLTDK